MPKDFSPEERLLRLIRSKTPKEISEAAPVALPAPAEKPKQEAPAPVPAPIVGKVSPPKEKVSPKISFDISGVFKRKNLNLALGILLAALLIYAIHSFLKSPKSAIGTMDEKITAQEKTPAQNATPAPEATQPSTEKRPPLDYFTAQTGSRNIFAPAAKEEAQAAAPVEQGPKLEEVKSQLSLLGVVGGAAPQAIIEDKRTQKTYFLNKGSTFDDIEVGDILENKVILIYKGKQFELIL